MPLIEDLAICVRTWDWSETSQTAVLLTREHGMIRVIAKGSKRDRSAFSGGLELCTLGECGIIMKPNSELALLTRWDLLRPMLGIRRNLIAYHTGLLGIDLIPRLIQDHDPHPDLFDALLKLLEFCDIRCIDADNDGERDFLGILAWYLWTILVGVGAMPVVDHDVLTGEALTPAEVYGFSAQLGGITQDPITRTAASRRMDSSDTDDVWRIRAQTVEMLNSLGQSPGVQSFLERSNVQNQRLARLLGSYIRERTGTEIPAMNWLLHNEKEP